MKKKLSILLSAAMLTALMPCSMITAQAKASEYYLSVSSDTYNLSMSGGTLTLEQKSDPTKKVTFVAGYTEDYTTYNPYTESDISIATEGNNYKVYLPELKKGQNRYPDYYFETTSISDYSVFVISSSAMKVNLSDEDYAVTKEQGYDARGFIYRDSLSSKSPAIDASIQSTCDPKDYDCSLIFEDYSSRDVTDDGIQFSWEVLGEDYRVSVVADSESGAEAIKFDSFENYSNRCFIKSSNLSSYALQLISDASASNVALVIDDKEYKFGSNKKVSLSGITEKKLHSVRLKSAIPDISLCQIDTFPDIYYTGKAQKPKVVLRSEDGSTELVEGTDYTVTYSDNKKIGYAKVEITGSGKYSGVLKAGFTIQGPKKGSKFKKKGLKYKVTNTNADKDALAVSVIGATKKTAKTVKIPATIKIGGTAYKVTSVAAKAFKGYKKLAKVTIGKNVSSIGKNAFRGDKAIKKLTVKSKKIKTVGANAFKGVSKTVAVKVPASKAKKYKKLFLKAGLPKNSIKNG